MNDFLKENGLEHAIPLFSYHKMEMNLLDELTEADIQELLPAIVDRINFTDGLKKIRDRTDTKSEKTESTRNKSNHFNQVGDDANIKEIAMRTLKSYKKLTDKLRSSAMKLITDHVPLPFYNEHQHALNGWDVINFENVSLNCPFCTRDIPLRYRPNTERFTWNICIFYSHLKKAHSNLAELKLRADGDKTNIG